MLLQAMPISFGDLFHQELAEARRTCGIEQLFDPSVAACTVLVLFSIWYGSARRVPQSLQNARDHEKNAIALHRALQRLYPSRYWGKTKKYHNMHHHVLSVGFAAGGWELVSSNTFELANKVQKDTVQHHTNRKDVASQVLKYQIRAMTVQRFDWMVKVHLPDQYIRTLEEQQAEARGGPAAMEDASGIHFPMNELIARKTSAVSHVTLRV